jgi:glycosyltransferase involved in cell wall biosynthesis
MGKLMLRVSVVTISFNQAAFLERAIRSVVEQDYQDIEYIVVDPGSTDGSRDIIERYRSRISKVIFEKDTGPANGLNNGFAAATGEVFGYINADDAFLPGAISKAVAAMQERPQADVVYAHSYIINETGKVVRRSRSVPFSLRGFAYGSVLVMQQSTFFRRAAFDRVGGFNETNRCSWDTELLVDMARSGSRLDLVNDYWSVFAIYPDSITGSGRLQQQCRLARARVFRKITGRDLEKTNKILFILGRIEKLLLNPVVPVQRVIDKFVGRTKLSTISSFSSFS